LKTIAHCFRWLVLCGLAVSLLGGCKIWDPSTWGKRRSEERQARFEAATPYAAQRPERRPPRRVIAVSGMEYQSSLGMEEGDGSAPGGTIVAEVEPVPGTASPTEDPMGTLDDAVRRERFGRSVDGQRWSEGAGEGAPEAAETEPDPFADLPYGIPVSGKEGFVNLPGKYSGLPQVDVRGIAPGTPVEVPNPTKPGEKIRFRVP